jgi:hypothetical protein
LISFPFQEAKVDELEAQLQNAQADLKSARKRIEQLHGALKDHEEDYSGDELSRSRDDSYGDGLSYEDSYSLGDDESLDLSDDDDEDDIVIPKISTRRSKLHTNDLSPALKKKDFSPGSDRRKKSSSRDLEEDDEFEASRRARQRRLKALEEEEAQLEAARKARQERMKELMDQPEHTKPSRKTKDFDKEEEAEPHTSSFKHSRKVYDDDDDEDDDDLEAFLLKQKERVKQLDDDDDDDDVGVSTIRSTRGVSSRVSSEALASVRDNGEQSHVTNGVNSSRKSEDRGRSEDLPSRRESIESEEGHAASRRKRERRRRRTIEQLTSPEHLSRANGVDL